MVSVYLYTGVHARCTVAFVCPEFTFYFLPPQNSLGRALGPCPIAIVIKTGGLKDGDCVGAGYTKANGTTSQQAG